MNLYEHTIIARQDTSPSQLKQMQDKYSKIVEKNEGNVVKLENWYDLNTGKSNSFNILFSVCSIKSLMMESVKTLESVSV